MAEITIEELEDKLLADLQGDEYLLISEENTANKLLLSTLYAYLSNAMDMDATELTNKVIDDVSNFIHANAIHFRAKTITDLIQGQPVKLVQSTHTEEVYVGAALVGDKIIGFAKKDMVIDEVDSFMVSGIMLNIDTSMWAENDVIFIGDSGLTNDITLDLQSVGRVLNSHAETGKLLVNGGMELNLAKDVDYNNTVSGLGESVQIALDQLKILNDDKVTISGNLGDLDDLDAARANLNVYSTTEIDNQQALDLKIASNLIDLENTVTARANLDVYSILDVDNEQLLDVKLANNLGDLPNKLTARTNLDVYSKSENDDLDLKILSNLSDVPNITAARTNLDVYSTTENDTLDLKILSNLSDLDDLETARLNLDVYSTTDSDSNFVDVGGDIMTGNLSVSTGNVDSIITTITDAGNSQIIRFENNTDNIEWDITTLSTELTGALQFKPNGLDTDKMSLSKSGILTATGFVGNITGEVTGNASTATILETTRTIDISGDITADALSFNGSADIDIVATVDKATILRTGRTISLSADATGSVVFDGSQNTDIVVTITDDSHNHVSANISDATELSTADMIVRRDTNSDFSANMITADLTGNASTSTILETARTISLSSDVTGSISFNGSEDIDIVATITDDSHSHDTQYYTESEIDTQQALDLKIASNLVDLENTGTARTNLNVYSTTEVEDYAKGKGAEFITEDLVVSGDDITLSHEPKNGVIFNFSVVRHIDDSDLITDIPVLVGGSSTTYTLQPDTANEFDTETVTIQYAYTL